MTEPGRQITPEQLIALNEEIATLVMAGVPLELGLRSLGSDVPSVLGRISHDVANRLQQGQSLSDSLNASIPGLPRIYTAAIESGLKSGQLPRTLELLCRFMQQGLELRQRIELAFLYPLIVFLLAYTLLMITAIESMEHWQEIWGDPRLHPSFLMMSYYVFCSNWSLWVWITPSLVLLVIFGWFFGRRSLLPDRRSSVMLYLVPGLYGVVQNWHWAIFCEGLAMLVEHQMSFPAALRLAGATTGNALIERETSYLAGSLEQGKSVSESLQNRPRVPAFLKWVLSNSGQPGAMLNALRHAGALYYERAERRAEAIKRWLPLGLIVIIGGGAVLVYALSCVLPIINLIEELGLEGDSLL
jgi:general secretion pathway protein F